MDTGQRGHKDGWTRGGVATKMDGHRAAQLSPENGWTWGSVASRRPMDYYSATKTDGHGGQRGRQGWRREPASCRLRGPQRDHVGSRGLSFPTHKTVPVPPAVQPCTCMSPEFSGQTPPTPARSSQTGDSKNNVGGGGWNSTEKNNLGSQVASADTSNHSAPRVQTQNPTARAVMLLGAKYHWSEVFWLRANSHGHEVHGLI